MSRLVCGRCGNKTAPHSTYCPRCRWTLYSEAPASGAKNAEGPVGLDAARQKAGFWARKKLEAHRAHTDRTLRSLVDHRLQVLEKKVEDDPRNFDWQRSLGLLAMLECHWERANAHLESAHRLNPHDHDTHVNYAIVLAQRGQLQPSLTVLESARKQWPSNPLVLFNTALVALQARRAEVVIEAVDALERLWWEDPTIAQDFHDEAVTARGLALLQLDRLTEARAALEAAARHTVQTTAPPATTPESHPGVLLDAMLEEGRAPDGSSPAASANGTESAESAMPEGGLVQLEGKTAEADLLNNLALTEAAQGETERATQRLLAALHIQPGHARVLNNLGVLAYRQGNAATALKYLQAARQIEEQLHHAEPATLNHLGVVLSSLGKLDEGLESFQHAGNHERAEFEVFYNLGRAYIEHGKPDKGAEFLKEAFHLDPNNADVHTVLGAAYLLRGKKELYTQALNHFKRALQLDPKHRTAFLNLALVLLATNDQATALKVISQTLKVYPQSAEAIFQLALFTMDRGDEPHWAQAAAQFEAAYALRSDRIVCIFNSALCQYLMGFREPASRLLEKVTQTDSSIAPAFFMIGVGHAIVDRFSEALAAWQKALQHEPDNADLHANMAFVYYQRGDLKQAIKHYMQAHQADPTEAHILSALGLCFARNDMMTQALTAFEQSLRLNPHSPVTHSNMGLAYYLTKKVEKAIEHWTYVSKLDKSYAEKREEEQQRSYDDSVISLRPLNWRARMIRQAPALPRPHARLLPGYNARAFRPAISDPALQEVYTLRIELERTDRTLAWMYLRT